MIILVSALRGAAFDYQNRPAYQSAVKWYSALDPSDTADFNRPLSEAKEEYERSLQFVAGLELKADRLLTSVGALLGIVLAGSGFAEIAFYWFLPTVMLLLSAIPPLLNARRAMNFPSPMEPIHLIEMINEGKPSSQMDGLLAGSYHCGLVGLAEVREYKSSEYDKGIQRTVFAIWFLCLPVLVRACCSVGELFGAGP
jgi:hypothetical protein